MNNGDFFSDINAALYEIEEAAADLVGQVESLAAEEDAQHLHALVKSLAKTVNDGRLANFTSPPEWSWRKTAAEIAPVDWDDVKAGEFKFEVAKAFWRAPSSETAFVVEAIHQALIAGLSFREFADGLISFGVIRLDRPRAQEGGK